MQNLLILLIIYHGTRGSSSRSSFPKAHTKGRLPLQAVLDAADAASQSLATIVDIRQESWL